MNGKLYTNGIIFTSDEKRPYADTMLVEDGRFLFVGSWEEFQRSQAGGEPSFDGGESSVDKQAGGCDDRGEAGWAGGFEGNCGYATVDLEGKIVLPGLIDGKTHIDLSAALGGDGSGGDSIPIWNCKSRRELLDRLEEHVYNHPLKMYYVAVFGEAEIFEDDELIREEIDDVVMFRPVVLLDREFHMAWLNTGALKLIGVGKNTSDIIPGLSCYERDEYGRLTGCVKEMALLPLVKLAGKVQDEDYEPAIQRMIDYYVSHGVTAIGDGGPCADSERFYRVLKTIDEKGHLRLRFEGAHTITDPDMAEDAVEELKRLREMYQTDNISFNRINLILDGTVRARTAKVIEPYDDDGFGGELHGGILISEERLCAFIEELADEGIDLVVHSAGDGAIKMVLDSIEKVMSEVDEMLGRITVSADEVAGPTDEVAGSTSVSRLGISITLTGIERIRKVDITRMQILGVGACMKSGKTAWVSDMDSSIEPNAVTDGSNLIGSGAGVCSRVGVAFASDELAISTLDGCNPFIGMEREVAMMVRDAERERMIDDGVTGDELERVLRGYTIDAAVRLSLDDRRGSIEPGKDADFLIVKRNIFEIEPHRIHRIKPDEVYIRGERVHRKGI